MRMPHACMQLGTAWGYSWCSIFFEAHAVWVRGADIGKGQLILLVGSVSEHRCVVASGSVENRVCVCVEQGGSVENNGCMRSRGVVLV